ncbi:recombinase family protein [Lysinibacillus fusiformis]|uniref:recombinase family protein n=1 Tax=Lysinibacillus fusiformis TaxID=28031 RepID=UPI001967F9E5|nr:recombinase family protein [Lysinibacillus fusiformis]QSB11489.1 recombinase family protein [Lysinibacillus fusiformis]
MIYGYIRPLYDDETCEKQIRAMPKECDKIYHELHAKPKKRTVLEELLMALKPGDTIIVERMFVLADTTRHLNELIKLCKKDGVSIQFKSEDICSNQSLTCALQEMMEHYIRFQTDVAKQSAKNGIINAREQGKVIGRPKKPDENIQKAVSMYYAGNFTLLDIKNETGISKSTLYRYLESVED